MGKDITLFMNRQDGWPNEPIYYQSSQRSYQGSVFGGGIKGSYPSGEYVSYWFENPERYHAMGIYQKLFTWQQNIGTDACRVYFSQPEWANYTINNTRGTFGTVFELLGNDYLTGAKTLDPHPEGYPSRRSVQHHLLNNETYSIDVINHFDVENFLFAKSQSSYYRGVNYQPPGAIPYAYLGSDSYDDRIMYYRTTSSTYFYDWLQKADYAVISDDTPGKEYFFVLKQENQNLWTGDEELEDLQLPNGALGTGYPRADWRLFWGYGRIQNLDPDIPEIRGTDPGWYFIGCQEPYMTTSVGPMMPSIAPLGDRLIAPQLLRGLDSESMQTLIDSDKTANRQAMADGTPSFLLPDLKQILPVNSNRDWTAYPYGDQRWYKKLDPKWQFDKYYLDYGSFPGQGNNTAQSDDGSLFGTEFKGNHSYGNAWRHRAPVNTKFGNKMGEITADIMVRPVGRSLVQSTRSSAGRDAGRAREFYYNGFLWKNFGNIAVRTDEVAP